MARTRSMLQTPRLVSAAEAQLNEDALKVGNNRTGVVYCDLYAGTTLTVQIETCSNVDMQSAGTGAWIILGTITFTTGAGSKKLAITDLGDAIRWNVPVAAPVLR